MSIKYQQGDVLLVAISEAEFGKIKKSNPWHRVEPKEKVTLAEGEATGHHHRFEIDRLPQEVNVTPYHSGGLFVRKSVLSQFPGYIKIEGGAATLYHEEHNPLTVPPGIYRSSIVREFDHIGQSTRNVVD